MTLFYLYAFILGCLLGSYANVIIFRLPLEKSTIYPRSQCPHCQHQIRWYENIPVLSYLFLKRKCSACHQSIHWSYPLIEIIVGIVSYLLFPSSLNPTLLALYLFYLSVFIVFLCQFVIDLKHLIIPDILSLYLGLLFIFYAFAYLDWYHSLIGFLMGLLIPAIVSILFYYLKKKEGLGVGDIKLFAVLGIYLGPMGIVENIFTSCFLGSIIGLLLISLKKINKDKYIPFGPFIIIAAFIQIYFPDHFKKVLSLFYY